MSGAKASFIVAATAREAWESALDARLTEAGFVVTSCETALDGPWRIDIYGETQDPAVAAAIADSARALGTTAPTWAWEALPDVDWVVENQRSFQPFAVGPFWVHPSHNAEGQPAGSLALRIDAGMAFGTGTHATTRGCLELLATLDARDTANAVDVGCGSGILAIAMAKLWQRRVLGGDNDAEAVEVAVENAGLNGVADLCRFVHAIGLDHPELQAAQPYDLVVANILAGPLVELSDAFSRAVRPGGHILLSGLLLEQAEEVLAAYGRRGVQLVRHVDRETGGAIWRTLLLRRR